MAGLITRVLVVDDYLAWRSFFSTALSKQPDVQVIGEASDGLQAVQRAQRLQPDLILLDIGLPTLNGIEAARRIRDVSPASKILFVSENRSAEILEAALNDGAHGYLLKSNAASELVPAIKAVLAGKRFVSASLTARVLATTSKLAASHERPPDENNPYLRFAKDPQISEFLAALIDSTGADFGTVQLHDSTNNLLRIVAQHGFEREFLDHFNTFPSTDRCACIQSMNMQNRIVVTDVAADPHFSDNVRGWLLQAKVRSLQATPLIDSSGKLIGVVSTHYSLPGPISPDVLNRIDNLAMSFMAKINA